MLTKEVLKKEIDKLPDNLVEEVYQFVNSVKVKQPTRNKIHTFRLKGHFDNINIREKAYE